MNTLVDQDDCDKTLWESESEVVKQQIKFR